MSINVYAEACEQGFTPQSLEAVSYAKQIANERGIPLIAFCINAENPAILSQYGANRIINIKSEGLKVLNAQLYAKALSQMSGLMIFPHTAESSGVAVSLSLLKEAELITRVVAFPQSLLPLGVKRNCFTDKVEMSIEVSSEEVVLTLSPKVFITKKEPVEAVLEEQEVVLSNPFLRVKTEAYQERKDLTTADIVVCAGRGLKAPENWQMIEDLAEALGGATACTRPISDLGWRDYNEHAGQTGKVIAPKLYIGVGVSGAIQHIAGVSRSKTIVAINNDPNAELFKYADYGIVGNAFEIVPKLIEEVRRFKAHHKANE